MKMLWIFLIAPLVMTSCIREDCEKNESGTLCITNKTNSEVTVSIDGMPTRTLDPNDEYCEEVSAKVKHSYHAEDDGIIGQSWNQDNITVVQCERTDYELQ